MTRTTQLSLIDNETALTAAAKLSDEEASAPGVKAEAETSPVAATTAAPAKTHTDDEACTVVHESLKVEFGPVISAHYDSVQIAPDNIWGHDYVEDEALRRLVFVAHDPQNLPPLDVIRKENCWAIVGDPLAYFAVTRLYPDPATRPTLWIPVREVKGAPAAVLFHTARQALGGQKFRNMRRARLSLSVFEVEGVDGKTIAASLGLHASGISRDLKAARMEREHPALAAILVAPSNAPVSYYTAIHDHSEQQPAPDKAMVTIVGIAKRLANGAERFSPTEAKIKLGVSKPRAIVRVILKSAGPAQSATLERTEGGPVRLVLTFADRRISDDDLERWLETGALSHDLGLRDDGSPAGHLGDPS